LISDKPLAFACTLNKKLEAKVRADVATIMSSGTPIEGIYVFCSRDMPIAKRHKLKAWARTEYAVDLEIVDGEAVSEWLSDRDLFWLAVRYLELATSLLPDLPKGEKEEDWYSKVLSSWRRETRPARTFADFLEIHTAARIALGPFGYDDDGQYLDGYDKPELPFWIERLDEITEQDTVDSVRRRAFYEASVLRLRGLGSLIAQEDRLRQYFASISQLRDTSALEDTSLLLTYVRGAIWREKVRLDLSEIDEWSSALEARIGEQISDAIRHGWVNEQCALLDIRGHMALTSHIDEGWIGATEAFKYWRNLIELAPRAPLFPLERFADRLTQLAQHIGSHPEYEPLSDAVDALVAERFGQFKVAEICLERAKAFRAAGDLPRAMSQLHRAKIDWFAEETLSRSLFAMDWLRQAYEEQGLFFAAKYYALASAYIVVHTEDLRLKPVIARSLERAAVCDYATGAWHGFLELAEACTIFYPHYARDPEADFNNPDGVLQHLIFYLGLLPVATKHLHPGLEPFARERCLTIADRVGFADVLEEVQARAETYWLDKGAQELWQTIEKQLAGPPWSDAGPVRHTQWKAHGITWNAQWVNNYETTLAAEGFLAALQTFQSDMAGYDLCLMRSTVNMSLRLSTGGVVDLMERESGYKGFDTHFEPSNKERLVTVTLPAYENYRDGTLSRDDLLVGALGIVNTVLAEVSLLPTERFNQILEERFAQGLPNKLMIGASYEQCLSEFIDHAVFYESARTTREPLTALGPFSSGLPEGLPWFQGPGPGYDSEEARTHITNRYERFTLPVAWSLRRLANEPQFQATVARLRAEGWKDWHILAAVFHVTVNYRANHYPLIMPNQEAREALGNRLATQPEPENATPVPLSEYNIENLLASFPMFMVSFAKTYGLQIHQLTPDFDAIDDFLTYRYNFWSDDVDHADPFQL
jgi:hypothetical protein